MNAEAIYIAALGASTSIGRDAWSSAAAVRAGISGFTQHPYMIDTAGEPMRVAIAPWLDIDLIGVERFEALLYPAIDQALAPLIEKPDHRLRIALSLGLPSPRPGLPLDLQASLVKAIGDKYRGVFMAVATFSNGHAAGLLALDAAVKKLEQGDFDACIVAGVDSYIEPETLEWLEENDQLHSAGPLNNAWGFIPGEAAGSVLLVRHEFIGRLRLTPFARILGVGTAFEPKRIKTETVCIGEGLTQAFRAALQSIPNGVKVTDVYCDMNGEPYRADEYGFTCLRTKEFFESASDFVAPADCWGDVSAAGGLLHMGLAIMAGAKGYTNGNYAFAWASSEGNERAAIVFELPRSE
ncbi:MAG: beta-ketoacyl synthase N-terminal-like domain-containing protein [Methylococcales bacterium]